MAPKPASDREVRKAYGRMIQPALPNLSFRAGAKSNKTKPAPASQQEVREAAESSTAHTVANRKPSEAENNALVDLPELNTSPDESFAHEERSVSTGPSSVAPQFASPTPQEQAIHLPKGTKSDEKEDAVAEVDPVANTSVELPHKDASTVGNMVVSSELTTSGPNNGQDAANFGLSRYNQPSEATSMVTEEENRRVLSGPGPAVADSPPASSLAAHNAVNGTQPFMQIGNGSSSGSQFEAYNVPEQTQPSAPSSVFHEQSVNGIEPLSMTGSTPSRPESVPRHFNALVPLPDHLISVASTKEAADWAVQVNPPTGQPFVTFGHGVILSRSLRLRKLMDRQKTTADAANIINLFPARQVFPHAFEAALRFLYSDTVLSDNFFSNTPPGPDHHATRLHNLDYIMSYWVAGIELGLEPVSICAERILSAYLKWDVVEVAYKNAIELGNSPISSVGRNMTGTDYLVASNSIIRLILQFVANNIDFDNFKLDPNNPSTVFPSRLPQLDDGRPRFNPALASMVFGSLPSSVSMSPSLRQSDLVGTGPTFPDTVASNILLNVDFENLNFFNELLRGRHNPESTKLMAAVVAEREARRLKILNTHSIPNRDRMVNSSMWEPVGLRESLNGTVLLRERVGFLLSSKPESNSSDSITA
ncbi:hypothetical protein A1O3_07032 [Capronia epimyces CBS 606.96]|uniref:BTB domain-containing protein n=1 Tax=Capronia epimyces CBS 606.96 TaxID=1182542 RepID=W9XKK0_9EURO|nr:uncharacterized protein A1O3_07032 [Capronia epimyces CBS 606.96]EXJ80748.1 hypothetical protein A1O3_07032 [Capronia epimyces CBS 606.96]